VIFLALAQLIVYGGRPCKDCWTISKAGIGPESTLQVLGRLRGGGGDGGATGAESRSSYLEMYLEKKPDKVWISQPLHPIFSGRPMRKSPAWSGSYNTVFVLHLLLLSRASRALFHCERLRGRQVDPAEERLAKWTRCQLSGEQLQEPVVCDELGHLFNKAALVAALVDKALPKSLAHISGLKSLINLRLERNANAKDKAVDAASFQLGNDCAFCCPVTGAEFNGRFRFVVVRPSGYVVSERAIKQVCLRLVRCA
jgi:Rtf2 RING-finger